MDKRHYLCNRIKLAKNWLSRAEDSFRDECDLRGELDLLLAEAELQRLREQKGWGQKRRRHVLAALAACCLFLASLGGWYALSMKSTRSDIPLTVEEKNVLVTEKVTYSAKQPAEPFAPRVREQTDKQYDTRTEKRKEPTQDTAPGFSKSELRSFVRTAGQTLRGK